MFYSYQLSLKGRQVDNPVSWQILLATITNLKICDQYQGKRCLFLPTIIRSLGKQYMLDKVPVYGRAQQRVLCPEVTLLLLENSGLKLICMTVPITASGSQGQKPLVRYSVGKGIRQNRSVTSGKGLALMSGRSQPLTEQCFMVLKM